MGVLARLSAELEICPVLVGGSTPSILNGLAFEGRKPLNSCREDGGFGFRQEEDCLALVVGKKNVGQVVRGPIGSVREEVREHFRVVLDRPG